MSSGCSGREARGTGHMTRPPAGPRAQLRPLSGPCRSSLFLPLYALFFFCNFFSPPTPASPERSSYIGTSAQCLPHISPHGHDKPHFVFMSCSLLLFHSLYPSLAPLPFPLFSHRPPRFRSSGLEKEKKNKTQSLIRKDETLITATTLQRPPRSVLAPHSGARRNIETHLGRLIFVRRC